jgi:hypothetical protein
MPFFGNQVSQQRNKRHQKMRLPHFSLSKANGRKKENQTKRKKAAKAAFLINFVQAPVT